MPHGVKAFGTLPLLDRPEGSDIERSNNVQKTFGTFYEEIAY